MRRRQLLGFLGGTAVFGPMTARAQLASVPVIAFLQRSGPIRNDFGNFLEGMRALGYEDGRNLRIEPRYSYGDDQKLEELARELVLLNPVAIVVDGTITIRTVQTITKTIPIVSAIISDPERIGIAELRRPLTNVTGLSTFGDALLGKRLEILKEIVPRAREVAVLRAQHNISEVAMRVTNEAATALGLNIRIYDAGERNTWPSTFAEMISDKCEGLLQFTDARLAAGATNLVVLAIANRLPTVYGEREFVDAGGLASYGISFPDQWRRAAGYVDKIIKGAKVVDLPVEQPRRFILAINVNTAKALGITFSTTLLARADEVIE